MNDDPIDELRQLLDAGKETTLSEITDELDISRRHARRLINQLRDEGLQVNERWEEGVKQFALDPTSQSVGGQVDLSEKELFTLVVASRAAHSVLAPTPLADGLKAAVEKLLAETGPVYSFEPEWQNSVWHFDSGRTTNVEPEIFMQLVRAANCCETLEIDYFSASSRELTEGRRIDPLVIAELGESWMVAAYCHESAAVLDFSIAGIRAARPTGGFFKRPGGFEPEKHFKDRFQALGGGNSHEVVLQVEADKAPYFDRKTYHPTQTVLESRDDDSILVEFEVASLEDIAAFVRSWGPGVWVQKPDRLATQVEEDARAVSRKYDARSGE